MDPCSLFSKVQIMTLLPGDIIATGTPSGIGALQRGDTIEIVIEGVGTLRNYVKWDNLGEHVTDDLTHWGEIVFCAPDG
jgi:hypothetical protein